ncbi:hypothetical protein FAES_2322 [Fibrella aestuarina BUZ 2]|uniref:PepSY domain-containing protein n=1 Tax=Fibrella aestuarina BUZ 2 TaxID=1166018 RepID=I0K878_9BACT|nr:hypothetical protein [Fibrella aestuarina]CCH00331.1 hypothetical protein FAES_2322 [Fibrella aestuarina BUZ 2]
MQKTLIATALLFALFVTNANAQNRRGNRAQTDTTAQAGPRFRQMEQVAQTDLPTSVLPYIKATYPNAEVRRVAKDKEGKFYVVLVDANKARKVLVTSSTGDILQTRDMPANMGRRGRGQGGNSQPETN